MTMIQPLRTDHDYDLTFEDRSLLCFTPLRTDHGYDLTFMNRS